MVNSTRIITITISILMLAFLMLGGCVTDPIKGVKNDPDKMDILMNHIANDDAFREKMVEKLTATGDRVKLAEQLVEDEDMGKKIMSKLLETNWGQEDLITRAAGQDQRLKQVLTKALGNFTNRDVIIEVLMSDEEMMQYMKNNQKFMDALNQPSPE